MFDFESKVFKADVRKRGARQGAGRRDRQRVIVKAAITVGRRLASAHKDEGDALGDNEFFRGIARSAERAQLTIAASDLGRRDRTAKGAVQEFNQSSQPSLEVDSLVKGTGGLHMDRNPGEYRFKEVLSPKCRRTQEHLLPS
jgi:hypothetical protein